MNRKDKINKLIDNYVNCNSDNPGFINNILRNGYKGYENMTTKELNAEFRYCFK
jgi:hypothetical protein